MKRIFASLLFFLSLSAFAQSEQSLSPPKLPTTPLFCQSEVKNYCGEEKAYFKIVECLERNSAELSVRCKQEIDRVIGARKQAAENGGGALTSFGGPNALGPPIPFFSYEGRIIPGSDKGTRQSENKVNLSAPVYRNDKDIYALSMNYEQINLSQAPNFNNGQAVPANLYRMEIGAQYMHQLSGDRIFGLRGSIGYAGDRSNMPSKDSSYSLSANYGLAPSDNGRWMLMGFIGNNSPLGNYVPIPGIAYAFKTDTLSGIVGFPMASLQWTPKDPWIFSATVFGLSFQGEAAYGHANSFQTFTGYSLNRQSYIPSVRTEDRDRLTLQEQKANLGFRWPLTKLSQGELQLGRSFDRSVSIGQNVFSKSDVSTSLAADWYASWALKFVF